LWIYAVAAQAEARARDIIQDRRRARQGGPWWRRDSSERATLGKEAV
jgi:hypothetical protein